MCGFESHREYHAAVAKSGKRATMRGLYLRAPVGSSPTSRTNHPAPFCLGGPEHELDHWGRVVFYAFSGGHQ